MATVTVEVWSTLGHLFADGSRRRRSLDIELRDGTTLAALLEQLAAAYPDFARVMYTEGTRDPSGQVAVVVNDRLPELLEGYETRLRDKDHVLLVQAYAGG